VAVKNANLAALGRLCADLLPDLTPLPVAADRTAGTLYKFHCRWSGDPTALPAVVDALAAVGMRVRRPVPGLHRTPMFRADGYGATDAFLAELVEFDTRDLYEPADDLVAGWAAALGRAVESGRLLERVRL
jgi:hypothetical protein